MSQLTEYLAETLKGTDDLLLDSLNDLSQEQLKQNPGGTANAIGPIFVHAITSEDALTAAITGQPTLWASEWQQKLGGTPGVADGFLNDDVKAFKLDPEAFKQYAQAVTERTNQVVRGMSDSDLERKLDMGEAGQPTVKEVVRDYMTWHSAFHHGEISTLRGQAGLQGVPF